MRAFTRRSPWWICGLLTTACTLEAQAPTIARPAPLPVVIESALPRYPIMPRMAGVEGVAVLAVRTDGKKIWVANHVQGSPMLLAAAEENVKTWRFKQHQPTGFRVTFVYRLEGPAVTVESGDDLDDNQTALLRLPGQVEIIATRKQLPTVEFLRR